MRDVPADPSSDLASAPSPSTERPAPVPPARVFPPVRRVGERRSALLRLIPGAPRPAAGPTLPHLRAPEVDGGRLVIVSNRLPLTVAIEDGQVTTTRSSGGLATGLFGVHEQSGGLWIGWSGAPAGLDAITQAAVDERLAAAGAVGIPLGADEIAAFYQRYANGVLWPALHDRVDVADHRPGDWATYRAVNERFAGAVARHVRPGDQVWVHDYHLMLVPRLLRALRPDVRIGFFLHTPFPTLPAFTSIPEHAALLDGMLGADVIGLHTPVYVARLQDTVRGILGRATRGPTIADGARPVHVHACPMSVDSAAFARRGDSPEVATEAARLVTASGQLLVGVDRLDYTKGIPERLRAFGRLLERRADLRGRVRLLQVAVPSREDVPAYGALRAQVEALVAQVNARFGRADWTPIEYRYGSVGASVLSALYRAADVMLVTPLRDGMNLVAKEFVATRTDGDGVLVLGQHAGAAAELRAALLVDPTDLDGLATTYETALALSPAERRVRMRGLRRCVRRHDVYQWARECLLTLGGGHAALVRRTAG